MSELPDPGPEWSPIPGAAAPPLPTHPPSVRQRNPVLLAADITGAIVGWLVLIAGAGLASFISMLFLLAPSVYGPDVVSDRVATTAMLIVVVGSLTAVIVSLVGTVFCAARQRYVFYWPLIGLTIVGFCYLLGATMADSA